MSSTAHHADAPLMLSVSGCRGLVGRSLTPEVVCRFAGAYAGFVKHQHSTESPTLVLARDGRQGGHAIHQIAAGALMAAGCHVIDLGVATTPTVGVVVLDRRAHGGIVLTASHNPAEWNGLKPISAQGGAPHADHAKQVIELFRAGDVALVGHDRTGRLEHDPAAAELHARRVLEALDAITDLDAIRKRRFHVVLDSVNASGSRAGRALLDELHCRVVHLNSDDSGIFPHIPEPIAENLSDLCAAVEAHKADAGFAQDPDADRLALVDEKGRFIGEEYTLALGALSLLSAPGAKSHGVIAANLSTSRMVDDIAARFGARVVRTAVGEANVVAGMRAAGTAIGGEGNGGVIWSTVVPIRDSLVAMGLTLDLMARTGKSLSELVAEIPAYAIEKRKLTLSDQSFIPRAISAVGSAFAGARIDTQDGIRADLDLPGGGAGWIHARPSNTEPIFRLIAEAPTRRQAVELLDTAQRAINA